MAIDCCKNCVPPKRHLGCHSKCKEYAEEKEEWDKKKEWERKNRPPKITNYDFEEINYAHCKTHKRHKVKKKKRY